MFKWRVEKNKRNNTSYSSTMPSRSQQRKQLQPTHTYSPGAVYYGSPEQQDIAFIPMSSFGSVVEIKTNCPYSSEYSQKQPNSYIAYSNSRKKPSTSDDDIIRRQGSVRTQDRVSFLKQNDNELPSHEFRASSISKPLRIISLIVFLCICLVFMIMSIVLFEVSFSVMYPFFLILFSLVSFTMRHYFFCVENIITSGCILFLFLVMIVHPFGISINFLSLIYILIFLAFFIPAFILSIIRARNSISNSYKHVCFFILTIISIGFGVISIKCIPNSIGLMQLQNLQPLFCISSLMYLFVSMQVFVDRKDKTYKEFKKKLQIFYLFEGGFLILCSIGMTIYFIGLSYSGHLNELIHKDITFLKAVYDDPSVLKKAYNL
ncbi:hypothetical protein NEFER03_0516 [Nematocida sp. LUAm3]|nr:hypothetical protein NEFER03_0516 [Nematocida sp. LUAm3]KAI5175483.1 hypothetical protein NEFER02_1389 [Nematocida sp. LUAm2]KAI5178487.1 hypothetical protein NEFER01_1634 [Nematocida sp. LUAm1]